MACPHPIENIMRTTMEQLKEMVDINTIVGDPVMASDGTMIIPISRVATGFVSGGGEYCTGQGKKQKDDAGNAQDCRFPFAGASAAGISLTPMSFVVVGNGSVKVVPAQYNCTVDRIIEMLPRAMEEIQKLAEKLTGCKKKYQVDQPIFDD
ncbi:MAG: GerW family sporulation protein [Christensenellales bacterium]|jgi:sporulation protein YtfJ